MSSSIAAAGRIDKDKFLISTSILLGAVVLSLGARLYVRLFVQKQFTLDDSFVIVGVCLLLASTVMLFQFIDKMYITEALLLGTQTTDMAIEDALAFDKWITASEIMLWTAINTVKFSFISLFRRLISRIRPMLLYWWFVVLYGITVWIFGVLTYFVPCPRIGSTSTIACVSGPKEHITLGMSVAQMTLDVLGDILILVIPVYLIWKIQIRWTQKVALAFSLCLSIVMIAVTLTRASGLARGSVIDVTWEVYWYYVSVEVGLLLSTATAFRTLFVSRSAQQSEEGQNASWYKAVFQRIKSHISSSGRASLIKASRGESESPRPVKEQDQSFSQEEMAFLNNPRPVTSGVRTTIEKSDKIDLTTSQFIRNHFEEGVVTGQQILLSRSVDIDMEECRPERSKDPIKRTR